MPRALGPVLRALAAGAVASSDVAIPKLQVIGGGKMGEALVAGLLDAGWARPEELRVVEKLPARADELADRFPQLTVTDSPTDAEGHLLAVKPNDVEAVCETLGAPARVLSIAAGVTLARLEAALPGGTAVVRAMPNTPALVGAGAAAIAPGSAADNEDMAWAEGILGSVGIVVHLDEKLLDAVTGLSGSGPAYLFLVVEALVDAGVLAGLPRPVSVALAHQTVLGAARMVVESGETPEALRAAVTSPGGTTAAGLRELERAGIRAAVQEAVMAATERARELGQG